MITDWRELNLQSMDIILCAGKSKISKRIQTFQRLTGADKETARISHVAGLYDDNHFMMMVQESTTLNKWANKSGVQINALARWIEHYNGDVYVRKLDFDRQRAFRELDSIFWSNHKDDSYESGIPGAIELLLCGLRLHRYVRRFFPDYIPKFTDEPHCTELQARRLDTHGLWTESFYPESPLNRMPPWIWWSEIDKWLQVPIGKPIRIK